MNPKDHLLSTIFIYNDLINTPSAIASVVGEVNFGRIQHGSIKIAEHLENKVKEAGLTHFFHATRTTRGGLEQHLSDLSNVNYYIVLAGHATIGDERAFSQLVQKISLSSMEVVVKTGGAIVLIGTKQPERVARAETTLALEGESSPLISDDVTEIAIEFDNPALLHIGELPAFLRYFSSTFDTRSFNTIESYTGQVVKSSEDVNKMQKEHDFYYFLPSTLQEYWVQPHSFNVYENKAEYRMKRYNFPDVAILWTHDAFNQKKFSSFLQSLHLFFDRRPCKTVTAEDCQTIKNDLYVNKVSERLEAFTAWSGAPRLIEVSNLQPQELFERYLKLLDNLKPDSDDSRLAITHGDLCFSNILFDLASSTMKFIDPRGAVRAEEIWSDPYYDLAKLSHSVLGNYDFIKKDMYEIYIDEDGACKLELQRANRSGCKALFKEFLASLGVDYIKVRTYEVSLFLSMLPLHTSKARDVLAFLIIADQLIEELEARA